MTSRLVTSIRGDRHARLVDGDHGRVDDQLRARERAALDPLDDAAGPEAVPGEARPDELADHVRMARHLDPQDVAQVPTDRLRGGDAVQALRGRVPGEDRQVGVEDPDRVRRGVDDLRRGRRARPTAGSAEPGGGPVSGVAAAATRAFGLGHARYPTLAIRGDRTPGSLRANREEDRALSWPLTDEERLLRDTAREFARRSIAPTAIERDEAERFDRSIFAGMGELGLAGAPLPESVGGAASATSAGRS